MTQTPTHPHYPTEWLSWPERTHVAVFHGATDGPEECWSVLCPVTSDGEGYCAGCDTTIAQGATEWGPADGQGDPIGSCCLMLNMHGLATLTPQQAADMSWWTGRQATPEEVGAICARW